MTEYGYETNPPDQLRGVTLDQQASYLSEATYLAWRDPDVRMFAQFLLQDIGPDESAAEPSPQRWADYQSGLITHDGLPKPSLNAFKLPFWVERAVTDDGTEGLMAFGQVRPGTGPRQMVIEVLSPDGAWVATPSLPVRHASPDEDCATFASDPQGFFNRFIRLRDGGHTLRAVWQRLDGPPVISQPVTVTAERAPGRIGSLLRPEGWLNRAGPAPDGHAQRQQARADQGQQPGVGPGVGQRRAVVAVGRGLVRPRRALAAGARGHHASRWPS